MQCPVDQTLLQMTSRQGIEIDYCPKCRGIWLDRGELDKLIEREQAPNGYATPPQRHQEPHHDNDRPKYDDDNRRDQPRHHKKESFLGDLFDF